LYGIASPATPLACFELEQERDVRAALRFQHTRSRVEVTLDVFCLPHGNGSQKTAGTPAISEYAVKAEAL
jgi:hypothetical protein